MDHCQNVITFSSGQPHPLNRDGSTLGQGTLAPPDSFAASLPPQIQKLADRSDVISDAPKRSKIEIFWGSASDPAGELTALFQTP